MAKQCRAVDYDFSGEHTEHCLECVILYLKSSFNFLWNGTQRDHVHTKNELFLIYQWEKIGFAQVVFSSQSQEKWKESNNT